ncbi:MAG: hypothetical protein ACPGVG_18825 [Mycobacterium sp.]
MANFATLITVRGDGAYADASRLGDGAGTRFGLGFDRGGGAIHSVFNAATVASLNTLVPLLGDKGVTDAEVG